MGDKFSLLLAPGLLCDGALWRHRTDHLADIAEIRVADVTGQNSIAGMARASIAPAPAPLRYGFRI